MTKSSIAPINIEFSALWLPTDVSAGLALFNPCPITYDARDKINLCEEDYVYPDR
jgi:hypothetical protein